MQENPYYKDSIEKIPATNILMKIRCDMRDRWTVYQPMQHQAWHKALRFYSIQNYL